MKKLLYILTAILIIACGSNIPDDVKYDIIQEKPNEVLSKDNLYIRLNKKIDETILKEIGMTLRETRKQYDKLWIFYFLPEMSSSSSAWATTHFIPDLEINIIGSTEFEDDEISKSIDIAGEILGKWRCEKSLSGALLILYRSEEGQLKMQIKFKDGTSMDDEIKESKEGEKIRYDDGNAHGEYYILESNGNLGMYGTDGKYDEAIIIK